MVAAADWGVGSKEDPILFPESPRPEECEVTGGMASGPAIWGGWGDQPCVAGPSLMPAAVVVALPPLDPQPSASPSGPGAVPLGQGEHGGCYAARPGSVESPTTNVGISPPVVLDGWARLQPGGSLSPPGITHEPAGHSEPLCPVGAPPAAPPEERQHPVAQSQPVCSGAPFVSGMPQPAASPCQGREGSVQPGTKMDEVRGGGQPCSGGGGEWEAGASGEGVRPGLAAGRDEAGVGEDGDNAADEPGLGDGSSGDEDEGPASLAFAAPAMPREVEEEEWRRRQEVGLGATTRVVLLGPVCGGYGRCAYWRTLQG